MVVIQANGDYKDKLFPRAYSVCNIALGGAYGSKNPTRINEIKKIGDIWLTLFE